MVDIAIGTNKPVEYDGEKGMITNHPDAASLVAPAQCKGWKV
jgi:hypothetical protein